MASWIDWHELKRRRQDRKWESFSWLTLRALLSSANDVLAKKLGPRLVNDMRWAWMQQQRPAELVVDRTDATSFILIGDTGEQDSSQYAVVPVLAHVVRPAGFMVIGSDVIYPAGDVNDYGDGFYIGRTAACRCRCTRCPATTTGTTACRLHVELLRTRTSPLPAPPPRREVQLARAAGAAIVVTGVEAAVRPARALREGRASALDNSPAERDPARPLLRDRQATCWSSAVDSGISGPIDVEQAAWLRAVSASSLKPKVLLPGKPLIDKMAHHPGGFDGGPARTGAAFASVDDVVRRPRSATSRRSAVTRTTSSSTRSASSTTSCRAAAGPTRARRTRSRRRVRSTSASPGSRVTRRVRIRSSPSAP